MRPEKEIRKRLEKLRNQKTFSSYGIKRATNSIIRTLEWVLCEREIRK